jgi:hypothetical protein
MVPPSSDPNSVAVHALDEPDRKRDARGREVERPADEIERPDDDRRRHYRRVRFAMAAECRNDGDGEGRVAEEVHRYRAVSRRRRDLCYMSRREQGEALQRAKAFAETYSDLHEDWHGTIAGLLLGSDDGRGSGDEDDDEDEDDEAVLILTESSARGLEFSSRFLRKHQEWTNRSVLRRHRQLREDAAGADADSALLGEHCARLNRHTSRMAARLGQGDALQARIVYEEDGVWATWKRDDRWEGDPFIKDAGGGDLKARRREEVGVLSEVTVGANGSLLDTSASSQ